LELARRVIREVNNSIILSTLYNSDKTLEPAQLLTKLVPIYYNIKEFGKKSVKYEYHDLQHKKRLFNSYFRSLNLNFPICFNDYNDLQDLFLDFGVVFTKCFPKNCSGIYPYGDFVLMTMG